jgi:hypothetical protein
MTQDGGGARMAALRGRTGAGGGQFVARLACARVSLEDQPAGEGGGAHRVAHRPASYAPRLPRNRVPVRFHPVVRLELGYRRLRRCRRHDAPQQRSLAVAAPGDLHCVGGSRDGHYGTLSRGGSTGPVQTAGQPAVGRQIRLVRHHHALRARLHRRQGNDGLGDHRAVPLELPTRRWKAASRWCAPRRLSKSCSRCGKAAARRARCWTRKRRGPESISPRWTASSPRRKGAACMSALPKLPANSVLKHEDRIVIYHTGAGLRRIEISRPSGCSSPKADIITSHSRPHISRDVPDQKYGWRPNLDGHR